MSRDLDAMEMFVAVADAKGLRAAAERLGVTGSAVSQALRRLEERLGVTLLQRTTRSVRLTEAGERLYAAVRPAIDEVRSAVDAMGELGDEPRGVLRLHTSVNAAAVIGDSLLAEFLAAHPHVQLDFAASDAPVDIVAEGYDAGVRLEETLERDMVQVRLTGAFRFVVVGAPSYLARHGTPERPDDLLHHECINLRSQTTGSPYAWELERGRKTWRVPARGGVTTNDESTSVRLAAEGLGLAYAFEPGVQEELRNGRLVRVLEAYAPTVPGLFLYFPSRAQRSGPLRLFIEMARELAARSK